MPAAMAGLPSGFDIARGVLAGIGRQMEAGGEFYDTVMGDDHPSTTDDRHNRITSDLCRSVRLQTAMDQLTNPPQGAPPADALLTMVYHEIDEFCRAQVDHEVSMCRTRLREAIGRLDLGGEFDKVHAQLDDVTEALRQVQNSWTDLVQVGLSNQAEAKLRERELELELRNFVSKKDHHRCGVQGLMGHGVQDRLGYRLAYRLEYSSHT